MFNQSGSSNHGEAQAPSIDQWFDFIRFSEAVDHRVSCNQLEWLYRNRERNGFHKAFRKIGKTRYVCKPIFEQCLLEQDDA